MLIGRLHDCINRIVIRTKHFLGRSIKKLRPDSASIDIAICADNKETISTHSYHYHIDSQTDESGKIIKSTNKFSYQCENHESHE